jgi:hypothetical protein
MAERKSPKAFAKCPQCGTVVRHTDARFCGKCGASLTNESSPREQRKSNTGGNDVTGTAAGKRVWVPIFIASLGILAIIGFFTYTTRLYFVHTARPGPCDSIFEQTAPRLQASVQFLKANGKMIIGYDKIQDVAEGAQRVAILCKTCCIAQQSGKINAAQFQDCVNTTKNYETQVLQVASSVDAANTARQQGHEQIANQKTQQAEQALTGAAGAEQKLGKVVGAIDTSPAPAATASVISAAPAATTAKPREPNDTILQANSFPIGASIVGQLTDTDYVDYFRFDYDSNLRDIINARVENTSTTLMPQITVYNSDKSQLQNQYNTTAGANLELNFTADPGQDYYVEVSGWASSTGGYTLKLTPQRAYDRYEPNDTALNATPVIIGQVLTANIMDSQDVDWYHLKGATQRNNISVRVENTSTTLMPQITVYNSDKSQLQNQYNTTAGANLELNFAAEPGQDYYVEVSGWASSAGGYKLSLISGPASS